MATVTSKNERFRPVVITLDTVEEAELIYEMLTYNISIPVLIHPKDEKKVEKLGQLMGAIRAQMTRVSW